MTRQTILWRRFDEPGLEICDLDTGGNPAHLCGQALFSSGGAPCWAYYALRWDPLGRTRTALVAAFSRGERTGVEVEVDPRRRWRLGGRPCPEVEGCEDLDLSFSPSTNALPIRRLKLKMGMEARVRSAWLRFPSFDLRPLEQVYRRIGPTRYSYRTSTGFRATLDVNRLGMVTRYGRIWKAVSDSSLA